jgi:hypothetical protein
MSLRDIGQRLKESNQRRSRPWSPVPTQRHLIKRSDAGLISTSARDGLRLGYIRTTIVYGVLSLPKFGAAIVVVKHQLKVY